MRGKPCAVSLSNAEGAASSSRGFPAFFGERCAWLHSRHSIRGDSEPATAEITIRLARDTVQLWRRAEMNNAAPNKSHTSMAQWRFGERNHATTATSHNMTWA